MLPSSSTNWSIPLKEGLERQFGEFEAGCFMVTICLVEPQRLVREGLRALLEKTGEFTVAAEGATGTEALRLIEGVAPAVMVLELLLPELHGLEVLRRCRHTGGTRAVVLTSRGNASYVVEAMRVGASAYVLKENSSTELLEAVRLAAREEQYLSKELRNCALEMTLGRRQFPGSNGEDKLTTRERMVMELVAEGFKNAEVGRRLRISRRTVESHRANLMQKLGLKTHVDLVRFAIRHNIIQP